jgi:tetratricopeptide (TPR) repeat protein
VPGGAAPDTTALADLLTRASRARAEGRHHDALALWEVVWNVDPGYEGVAQLLEEEYRISGLDAFARGRTEEAIALWRKALRLDPEDRKTQAYLAHAEAQRARLGNITGAPNPTP